MGCVTCGTGKVPTDMEDLEGSQWSLGIASSHFAWSELTCSPTKVEQQILKKKTFFFVKSALFFGKKLRKTPHGQASVERGFSINKEMENATLNQRTLIAKRHIVDFIR